MPGSGAAPDRDYKQPMKTAELGLVVEACKAAFDRDAPIALPATTDWNSVIRLARFHRVQGLMWQSLSSLSGGIPDAAARDLASDAQAIAAANLRIAVEAGGLRAALEGAGMRPLFLKGLIVAALAYPEPMLKAGWDIDVLVAPDDVLNAAAQLERRGYRRIVPSATADLIKWHVHRKESVWGRPEEQLYVELHTRLMENPALIPAIGDNSPRREVEVMRGITLPALAPAEMFAHLCAHGAVGLWFRLKWITDLAALLHNTSPDELERLYHRSIELGGGRSAAQALLLADALYGTLAHSERLRAELSHERVNRWLLSQALKQLCARSDPVEPTGRRFGTLPMHIAQLALQPGIKPKIAEILRQARVALLNAGSAARRGTGQARI